MASGGGNAQYFFGGFTGNNNNPPSSAGGAFSFGFPTSFSGESTTTYFGTTSPFLTRQTSNVFTTPTNNSFTRSPFGTAPYTTGQTLSTSPFGTAPPSFTQTNSSSTTQPFGTAPFSFQHISTPSPFGTSLFSTGQTNNSSPTSPFGQTSSSPTVSPFGILPPSPFSQTNNSSTTSPFGTAPFSFSQTSNSLTTSPGGTTPFSFPQTSNSLTTPFPFGIPPSSPFGTTVSTPTTPACNVSVFPPFMSTVPWKSIVQGTRHASYEETAEKEADGTIHRMLSISAMPFYEKKSPEELRFEDYTLTGGVSSFGFPTSFSGESTTTYFGTTSPFSTGQTSNVFTAPTNNSFSRSPFGTAPPPNPFGAPPPNPFGSLTTSPFTIGPPNLFSQTNNSSTTSPFGQTSNSSTTSPCGTAPLSFQHTNNSLTTPPFGTPSSSFGTAVSTPTTPANNVSAILPFWTPSSPFGTTVSTPTTPANNVSEILPFWTTVPWKSNVQGTREKAYEETAEKENTLHKILSISAMPSYEKKSHEELRLEDYTLTGKAGISSKTTSNTVPNSPSTSLRSVPSTSNTYITPNIQPISQPVITPFQKFDYPFSTSQTISITVPNSTTGVLQNSTVPVTSIPATEYYKDPYILPMIPKLRSPKYYMEPSTEDLEEIELSRPGFCCKVKDFVIGRRNYGSIKFLGETDVRNLDVEFIVQFADREVVVYRDKKRKPPVGQGLNKAAEITLLNVKCIDESTGNRCIDGPSVDKYKELLKRKATEQDSEFVSYDPVKGEWRFKVEHF